MTAFRSSGDLAADRRYLWADASRREGDLPGAADLFRQAVDLAPYWAAGWFALGETLMAAGDSPGAAAAFDRCLTLDAEDALGAGVRLAILRGEAREMPAAYVAGLFDDYAARFDAHLVGALEYRGPELLRSAIDDVAGASRRFETFLDLGCGTGLMAEALRGRYDSGTGVDLSPAMLQEAEARGLYQTLTAADAVAFLDQQPAGCFDLVAAADVLVYIGDLAPLFVAVRRTLALDGLFAFSVQAMDGDGYRLGPDMRFHHAADYVAGAAALTGLSVRLCQNVSTRRDAGVPVPGLVFLLAPV